MFQSFQNQPSIYRFMVVDMFGILIFMQVYQEDTMGQNLQTKVPIIFQEAVPQRQLRSAFFFFLEKTMILIHTQVQRRLSILFLKMLNLSQIIVQPRTIIYTFFITFFHFLSTAQDNLITAVNVNLSSKYIHHQIRLFKKMIIINRNSF